MELPSFLSKPKSVRAVGPALAAPPGGAAAGGGAALPAFTISHPGRQQLVLGGGGRRCR